MEETPVSLGPAMLRFALDISGKAQPSTRFGEKASLGNCNAVAVPGRLKECMSLLLQIMLFGIVICLFLQSFFKLRMQNFPHFQ